VGRALPVVAVKAALGFAEVAFGAECSGLVARFVGAGLGFLAGTDCGCVPLKMLNGDKDAGAGADRPAASKIASSSPVPTTAVDFRDALHDFVAITLDEAAGDDELAARPEVLWRAISRMVSTDSCLAVSMKLQVLTTRILGIFGVVGEARAGAVEQAHHDLGVDEVLGQPNEIKPTEGAVGGEVLINMFYCS